MASTHVLRIRRTDDPSSHLLLHVTSINQARPLDLKLVATEHEHLYHGSLKSSNLAALQTSNYHGDDDEWRSVIAFALLQQRPDANLDALQGLETVAAINGETCTLTLRKNIGGITQRLGSIRLDQDDEREEVSAFEWVDTAVAASDALRADLVTLQKSLGSQQSQVAKLTEQLDELVKAKKQHEEDILRKCAVLLDSKKAKIRDLEYELGHIAKNPTGHAGHKAGNSARGKRKANSVSPEEEDEHLDDAEDDDDLADEEEDGQQTPEQETEDEGSEDGFAAPPPEVPTKTSASSRKHDDKVSSQMKDNGKQKDVGPNEIPPRRELPFQRRTTRSTQSQEQAKASTSPTAQEDGDTDDDEL
ncbi:hypothetical protein Q7P37_010734 [Cladosporium fusiforme]